MKQKLQEFLNYIKAFRAKGTYNFYKQKLNVFLRYSMKKNISLDNITLNDLLEFITFLRLTNKNNSINKYINCLNIFLRYFKKDITLDKLKNDSKRFIILSELDLKKVMDYIKNLNLKHRLIIKLFIDTGIRIKELTMIKIKNINLDLNNIYLEDTKTKVCRYIFFSDYVKKDLIDYLESTNQEELFVVSYTQIYRIFNKLKQLDIKEISPHILRHTFATRILRCGIDIHALQMILGHSSLKTTEIYLHYNQEDLKNFYTKAINNNFYKKN